MADGIKLWLDDERPAPKGWVWVTSAAAAIEVLSTGNVIELSFDHDLGDERVVGNGYIVAKWIEEMAFFGHCKPFAHKVHSGNPVGRKNIEAAMANANVFWAKK